MFMIFSSFNPMNFYYFFIFINMLMFNSIIMNLIKSKSFYIKKILNNFIFNDIMKINFSNLSIKILTMIFIFNMTLNLNDLLPYSFCINTQLNILFFFSFLMWFSCLIFYFNFKIKNFIIHLTPMSCPMILSPFMTLIEIISLIIRPITLSVRMSANMMAGHLMIHLISSFSFYIISLNSLNVLFSLMLMISINMLELMVCLIQPYIFCVLINMYFCENN